MKRTLLKAFIISSRSFFRKRKRIDRKDFEMIEVSEIIAKVRERLNDNEVGNYGVLDSVLVENINQALLKICLEFKLNKTITRALITEEERFLTINNLLGIESVKLDKKEIENRNTIEKDNGEIELLILSDKLSVTPFRSGELEVVHYTYEEVNNVLDSINMPKICLDILVYSVLCNLLEIPNNETNFSVLANYKQLLKLAKDNLTNYLSLMYSKNIHFSKVVRV
ncbi:putative histidine kinase [Helicobacter phage phiHP33]|uniref:putative histidine kinase n=1 Tax=Helicobacter phage phiHP33 TaxID=1069378 RepID=UPI00023907C8|nr:putative histidine kinase [Helicobacter phage phiHP33]AET85169.1 putative histidine kinase [Helicobacter phage phiHP33]